jgi:putative Ca2+/H+ antiporter (TMEM165/GDT1 family)
MNYVPSATLGFYHAFIASLSVVVVSEIGDKTWFIAAVCHLLSLTFDI